MAFINLTINGRPLKARHGETLLEVARTHGIPIPTLCSLEGLKPMGGCRLCIVEVEEFPRPVPACATGAEAGMVVTTESARLRALRRMVVELLLAERNHTCPVCVVNGACELQALAATLGIDHVRYAYISPRLQVDLSHERFGIDHNRCILCRRCVRVCDEIEGAHVWDASGRGADSRIISGLREPWGESNECTDCGKCVQACPTGALFEKDIPREPKEPAYLKKIVAWRERREG